MKSKKQSRSSKAPASCSEAEELGRLKLVRRLLAGSAVEVTEAEAIRRLRVADAELKEMDLRRRSGELIELAKARSRLGGCWGHDKERTTGGSEPGAESGSL